MSKTDSLHYQLCLEGAKWLHRQKRDINRCAKRYCYNPEFCWSCHRYKYVAVELCTVGTENCDVWGYDGIDTAVIEVKTSHADFLADKKKWWRSDEAEKMNCKAGTYRWYLCPEGVIKPEELPEGWGLLYWDGKKITYIKGAPKHENTARADLMILYSILRREGFPEKIYNYRHQNTTIKPQKYMETTKVITPYFENGVFSGVRVTLGDEDFVIAPKDFRNGKEMDWQSAMDALNADNLSTWSCRQVRLTMAYRKEVDKALKDNGGDNLEDCYWTCVENSECSSFIYFGINNTMDIINKLNSCVVRPIKNLKQ